MEKYPLTKNGFEELEKELLNLKSVERPAVIEAIAEARAHGDLSENAEYSAFSERSPWALASAIASITAGLSTLLRFKSSFSSSSKPFFVKGYFSITITSLKFKKYRKNWTANAFWHSQLKIF